MTRTALTIDLLCREAEKFCGLASKHAEAALFGVTDGKAIGTYVEHKFKTYLHDRYVFVAGSSANGVDFPELGVDMKATSIRQPQSSCPFRSARQKVYGLGYGLLVFVYDKADDAKRQVATLRMTDAVFVEAHRTADFQMTRMLRQIVENEGNEEDLMALLADKNLPADEIERRNLAEEILRNPPELGFLTISNALQWRLQYGRVIEKAGTESGLRSLYKDPPVAE